MKLCESIKEYNIAIKLNSTKPKIIYDRSNNSFNVIWYYSEKLINRVYNNLFVKIVK